MRRIAPLLILLAVMAGVVAAAELVPALAGATTVAPADDHCGPAPAAAGGIGGFLTGWGAYRPRTHCMVTADGRPDWGWIGALIAINAAVIIGYLRIFVFWRRAYLSEAPGDRNTKLMDLAWIFLWCAACGYIGSIAMFFWPGYRAMVLCLVPLAFFTWRFAFDLRDFRVALQAKRLQRELTEALRRRNEELERAVAGRTAELAAAREESERANGAKSDFLANMSHEIRTPLTAVLGFVDLLDDPGTPAAERSAHAAIVRRNGRHLLAVVNDILDLSKIEAGQMRTEAVACNPARIVLDVVDLHRPRAADKGLHVGVEVAGAAPIAGVTDPTRLRQIVNNLLSNAVKFTASGGVRVVIGGGERDGATDLIVRVIDTGPGLTGEQCRGVFDPFRQGGAVTPGGHAGTGLGLAISRRLARALGGDVTVSSTPGSGSTFTARVVLGDSAAVRTAACLDDIPNAPEPADGPAGPMVHADVLLVDDGEDSRRLAEHHLRRAGARVATADNGRTGVDMALAALARGEPYDIVLMDMQMPWLDGYDAARELRRRGYTLPIVALTACAMLGDRQRCLEAGCDDYLAKPLDVPELRRACARAAARARAA